MSSDDDRKRAHDEAAGAQQKRDRETQDRQQADNRRQAQQIQDYADAQRRAANK